MCCGHLNEDKRLQKHQKLQSNDEMCPRYVLVYATQGRRGVRTFNASSLLPAPRRYEVGSSNAPNAVGMGSDCACIAIS